jgi:hypothetical protein
MRDSAPDRLGAAGLGPADKEDPVTVITDDYMRERLKQAASYCLVILKRAAGYDRDDAPAIIWEHGRRNMSLQADGLMPIVCPVPDESEIAGIGIFTRDMDEVRRIMDDDPGVQAGVFSYEVHPCRSFPGSALPPL